VVVTQLAGIQTALKTNDYSKNTLNKEVLMLLHFQVYLYFDSCSKGELLKEK